MIITVATSNELLNFRGENGQELSVDPTTLHDYQCMWGSVRTLLAEFFETEAVVLVDVRGRELNL